MRAKSLHKTNVYIATDDKRINDLCKKHDFKTIITPKLKLEVIFLQLKIRFFY